MGHGLLHTGGILHIEDLSTKNPGVRTLHKIALAFGLTLAEFLDFAELNEYSFDEPEEEEEAE